MLLKEYIERYCIAHGGNWTQMLLSGIERWNPQLWASLPEKEYEFGEVCDILKQNGIVTE